MKKRQGILKDVPVGLWIVIGIVLAIILFLPAILTRPGWLDFSETGQIGDTIGGIMGPFIAIVAALLTFVAFWVQYEANIKQREDISIERQEAKFYKMLDIYSAMTNEVEIHGFKGKEVFTELVGEFTYTFFTIDKIFNVSICDEKNISKMSSKVKELVDELKNDRKKYNEYITNLSYNLFFYGMYYTIIDFQHPERTELGEAIKNIAFQLNIPTGKGSFSNYVKSRTFDIQVLGSGLTYPLFEGHSDFLGHYFRHLFQMVKYVSSLDNSLYKEEDKEGYVKILRSQMSDYEQILLYYNSLSEQGSAWNKTHGVRFPEDAGYISRYRMIKNLPPNFPVFGVIPYELYKKEAEKWEKRGKKFYEHKCLLISKSALDNKR